LKVRNVKEGWEEVAGLAQELEKGHLRAEEQLRCGHGMQAQLKLATNGYEYAQVVARYFALESCQTPGLLEILRGVSRK